MSFYIGQKVVCINNTPMFPGENLNGLRKNAVYTIRWHGFISLGYFPSEYKVRVEELYRKKRSNSIMEDLPYLAHRFKPLREKPTSIEVFERLLHPKEKEKV